MDTSPAPQGVPPAQPVAPQTMATITYATALPKLTPTTPGERIETLDILRGVAVMGILVMNIYSFAFPFWEYSSRLWPKLEGTDAILTLTLRLLASYKFQSIFALLFGAGMAILSERAAAKHSSFLGMYSRRLTILLVIGILHGVLLWHGDILAMYAIIGFIAMLLRNLKPKYLLMLAAVAFMVPIAFAIFASIDEHRMIATQAQYPPPGPFMQRLYDLLHREPEIYGYGTYGEITLLRTAIFGWLNIMIAPRYSCGYSLSLFLLGIVFIRKGILSRPRDHTRTLKRLVVYGLVAGCLFQIIDNYLLYIDEMTLPQDIVRVFAERIGPFSMSFAYVGIITLISLRLRESRLLHSFACVGRMALSNYIGQSVICTLIFYGYGLGLFDELTRLHALIIAFAVFSTQMIISPIWLRYFRYGPLEWLWRTLTYMKMQPMLASRTPTAAEQFETQGASESPSEVNMPNANSTAGSD